MFGDVPGHVQPVGRRQVHRIPWRLQRAVVGFGHQFEFRNLVEQTLDAGRFQGAIRTTRHAQRAARVHEVNHNAVVTFRAESAFCVEGIAYIRSYPPAGFGRKRLGVSTNDIPIMVFYTTTVGLKRPTL